MTTSDFTIDLNCDMGESFGAYRIGNDEAIMPLISSASIACGFHAGDASTMGSTVRLALQHHVAIGAHPGLPDLQGFGRRQMQVSPQEVYDMVLYQIGALSAFVKSEGATLRHVKPHGALYNTAAADEGIARAIAEAVYSFGADLILYGLSGSKLIECGREIGLRTASEVFADRSYQPDGSLTPRSQAGALITDTQTAIAQAIGMVKKGHADTICLHGDGAHALEFARAISGALIKGNIRIQALTHIS